MRSALPLQVVCIATALFGAALVLAPATTRAGFGLIMFGDGQRLEQWPAEVRGYVTLVHGVLGAVMVGWAASMLLIIKTAWATQPLAAWRAVVASVLGWAVPDMLFSISQNAWPNVALNMVFVAAFAVALVLCRPRSSGVQAIRKTG
jgi:hypothetical protein